MSGTADVDAPLLRALAPDVLNVPRRSPVAAHLHERNGDLRTAARLYAEAARDAPSLQERAHQTHQAARINQLLRDPGPTRPPAPHGNTSPDP